MVSPVYSQFGVCFTRHMIMYCRPLWCGPPSHRMFCATANLGQKKKNRKTLTLRMYKDQAFKPEWSQNELK